MDRVYIGVEHMIDAHEIVPLLWQGSKPRPGPAVADAGFEVLVFCARDHQPSPEAFPGLEFILAPNDDHVFMTKEDLTRAVNTASGVAERLLAGKKILVTCFAGINRSGLVVALTLHKAFGYSGRSCIDLVRKGRILADGDDALTNTFFVEALLKLPGEELVVPPRIYIRDHRGHNADRS
jgi:hypothetical protein